MRIATTSLGTGLAMTGPGARCGLRAANGRPYGGRRASNTHEGHRCLSLHANVYRSHNGRTGSPARLAGGQWPPLRGDGGQALPMKGTGACPYTQMFTGLTMAGPEARCGLRAANGRPYRGLRCSKYTSSTATSAGLTPEIRDAWPMLTGRILFSFSRASAFRAGMAS